MDTRRDAVTSPPPPSYNIHDDPVPSYESREEPDTLAYCLFKYGFLFPPFWFFGALILCIELRPVPEAECGKTAEEQADELALLRGFEVKWARRSCCAAVLTIALIIIILVALKFAQVGTFAPPK
ncbi:hypothetical protein BOTBODRAFT_102118 [Botryobasidium botryosum FD-172 SS1]|uniref:Transmembrane protein n=1 Tax=Botryobasidium botryosum (strain FD-172 SS1) TaxID=930990 RepID=A0A067MXF9_BOTB1|nr:hypothetical protein BOTBODRAFT_102118 [Botryobasidium botryosum FD-172 SS1]